MGAVGVGEAEFVSQQSDGSSSPTGSALQPGCAQPVGQPGKWFMKMMAGKRLKIISFDLHPL